MVRTRSTASLESSEREDRRNSEFGTLWKASLPHILQISDSNRKGQVTRPPLYTLLSEVVGWTLDRTADIPKNARFTFGQRLDNLALDALQSVVKAVFAGDSNVKQACLSGLLLELEQMQALWRLAHDRRWLSQQQVLFISQKLAEAGRMANGWRQQQQRRSCGPNAPPASPGRREAANS